MKKLLALIVVLTAITMIPLAVSAQQVAVTVPDFAVVVNGRVVDNNSRVYPFILYNSITYFPMTYEDCAYLGLENNWTAESGNVITKTVSSGVYRDFADPSLENYTKKAAATIVTTPITVMGSAVNNAAEQYPILNYNNVLYFPLTWDWSTKFGWKTYFSDNRFLEVSTDGFADSGYYYTYDVFGNDVKEHKKSIAEAYSGLSMGANGYESLSPNYFGVVKKIEGFVPVYKLTDSRMDYPGLNQIIVKESLLDEFKGRGWFTVNEAEGKFIEYLKTHSIEEYKETVSYVRYDDYDMKAVCNKFETGYTSLYSSDMRACAVPDSAVDSYLASGWMRAEKFLDTIIYQKEKKGDIAGAYEIIDYYLDSDTFRNHSLNLPGLEDYSYDKYYEKQQQLSAKLANQLKSTVSLKNSFVTRDGDVIMEYYCVIPSGKAIKSFDVSYDIADITGKVIDTVSTTEFVYLFEFDSKGKSFVDTQMCIDRETYPQAYSVKNVKVSNTVIINEYEVPLGQG